MWFLSIAMQAFAIFKGIHVCLWQIHHIETECCECWNVDKENAHFFLFLKQKNYHDSYQL